MKVFLTGAGGYIGKAVSEVLRQAKHEVVGLTHSPDKVAGLKAAGVRPVVGDIKKPDTYRKEAEACDVLIHAASEMSAEGVAADKTALETLIAAAKGAGQPRFLIYTSGVWVLGNTAGKAADEASAISPLPIVAWRPAHEKLALGAAGGKFGVAVLRPGCVYGGKAGLFGMMFQAAVADEKISVVGNGKNRWATVYLDDLAEVYRLAVEKKPSGAVLHAIDDGSDSVADIAQAFLDAVGKSGAPSAWPLEEARKKLGPFADALAVDQRISSAKTRALLGWKPKLNSAAKNAELLFAEWQGLPAG